MERKSVNLVDTSWVKSFVEAGSPLHALLAERLHTSPTALDSESKVLAGLIELGRRLVEADAETALYNEHYSAALDAETHAAFVLYDGESLAAAADEVGREASHR